MDPIYQHDRPFRKADFRFSMKRLLIAMVAVAGIMTVGMPRIGRYDGSVILIGVVLAILFNDWSLWRLNRGIRALGAGLLEQAIADFSAAIDAAPHDAIRHYYRASARYQMSDFAGAREDATRSAQLAPDSALPLALRGWINCSEGRNEEAREDFKQAMELDPMLAHAEVGYSYVAFQAKSYAEAIRLIGKCYDRHPQAQHAGCFLAWFLATCPDDQLRNGSKAVSVAEAIGRLGGERFFWGESALAAAYAEEGRFAEAVEHAEHAVRLAEEGQHESAAEHLATVKAGKAIRVGES